MFTVKIVKYTSMVSKNIGFTCMLAFSMLILLLVSDIFVVILLFLQMCVCYLACQCLKSLLIFLPSSGKRAVIMNVDIILP